MAAFGGGTMMEDNVIKPTLQSSHFVHGNDFCSLEMHFNSGRLATLFLVTRP